MTIKNRTNPKNLENKMIPKNSHDVLEQTKTITSNDAHGQLGNAELSSHQSEIKETTSLQVAAVENPIPKSLIEKSFESPVQTSVVDKSLHIPVMLKEVLEAFAFFSEIKGEVQYFDGTFGRGGHLRVLFEHYSNLVSVAMDRDIQAVEYAQKEFENEIKMGRLSIYHGNYKNFSQQGFSFFDGMLLDLGVSSPQLDDGLRGFSFYNDGPLDMRMDNTQGPTAADLVASLSEEELIQMFQEFGEISRPFRVVRAIAHDRKKEPFLRSLQLAQMIERVEGWSRKGHHPATRYFMALRMKVNNELENLEDALVPLILGLKPKGRLVVLTFHSLEDRIVKNTFKGRGDLGITLTKKVIKPTREEELSNPRARSAKLRIFERIREEGRNEGRT